MMIRPQLQLLDDTTIEVFLRIYDDIISINDNYNYNYIKHDNSNNNNRHLSFLNQDEDDELYDPDEQITTDPGDTLLIIAIFICLISILGLPLFVKIGKWLNARNKLVHNSTSFDEGDDEDGISQGDEMEMAIHGTIDNAVAADIDITSLENGNMHNQQPVDQKHGPHFISDTMVPQFLQTPPHTNTTTTATATATINSSNNIPQKTSLLQQATKIVGPPILFVLNTRKRGHHSAENMDARRDFMRRGRKREARESVIRHLASDHHHHHHHHNGSRLSRTTSPVLIVDTTGSQHDTNHMSPVEIVLDSPIITDTLDVVEKKGISSSSSPVSILHSENIIANSPIEIVAEEEEEDDERTENVDAEPTPHTTPKDDTDTDTDTDNNTNNTESTIGGGKFITRFLFDDNDENAIKFPGGHVTSILSTSKEGSATEKETTAAAAKEEKKSSSTTAAATTIIDYKVKLMEFYTKHNPSKLHEVDARLDKWEGNEEELFRKLYHKYGLTPQGEGGTTFKYWRSTVDGKTGNTYYYNSKTFETSWKKPRGFQQGSSAAAADSSVATSAIVIDASYHTDTSSIMDTSTSGALPLLPIDVIQTRNSLDEILNRSNLSEDIEEGRSELNTTGSATFFTSHSQSDGEVSNDTTFLSMNESFLGSIHENKPAAAAGSLSDLEEKEVTPETHISSTTTDDKLPQYTKTPCSSIRESLQYLWTIVKYDYETMRLLRLAIPFTFSAMAESLTDLIILGIISQNLGTNSMVAYAMVDVFAGVSGEFNGGWIEAISSLGSMAFGARNYELGGKYAQIACVAFVLCEIPMAFVWGFSIGPILRLMGFPEEVATLAGTYIWVQVAVNMMQGLNEGVLDFLEIIEHEQYSNIMFCIVAFVQLGLVAAVAITTDSSLVMLGLVMLAVQAAFFFINVLIPIKMGWLRRFETGLFGSFSCKNRQIVKDMFDVALPLSIGNLLAYAEWEVLTIFAAFLGPAEVATWAVLGFIWDVFESSTEAIGDAGEVRVSYQMGKGRPELAKLSAYKSIFMGLVLAIIVTAIFLGLSGVLPSWLTADPTIREMLSELFPLMALGNITMTVGMVCWALVGAQGRYRLATSVATACSLFITIPIGAVVTIYQKINLQGLTFSVVVGYTITAALLATFLFVSDWETLSEKIQAKMAAEEMEEEDDDSDDDDSSSSSSSSEEEGDNKMLVDFSLVDHKKEDDEKQDDEEKQDESEEIASSEVKQDTIERSRTERVSSHTTNVVIKATSTWH